MKNNCNLQSLISKENLTLTEKLEANVPLSIQIRIKRMRTVEQLKPNTRETINCLLQYGFGEIIRESLDTKYWITNSR